MGTLRNLILGAICMILVGSCDMDDINCVRVEGEVETQKRTLGSFNSIFFGDVGNLHISQGNEQSFIIKGQKTILDKLKAEVNDDGKLIVDLDACFNGEDYSLDIFITAPEIKEVEMSGVGYIKTATPITTDVFTLKLNGVLEDSEMNIQADSISTYLLGTGNITYKGSTKAHSVLYSGTGNLSAYDMISQNSYITSNGVGNIYVTASDYLEATTNNVGNIYYKGDPVVDSEENDSVGKVINDN